MGAVGGASGACCLNRRENGLDGLAQLPYRDPATRSQHFPGASNRGASSTHDLPSSLLTAIFEMGYRRTNAEEFHDPHLTLNKVLRNLSL